MPTAAAGPQILPNPYVSEGFRMGPPGAWRMPYPPSDPVKQIAAAPATLRQGGTRL